MDLKNKTILITGGGSGIGLEATRQFLQKGAKVIITGRDKSKLEDAKKLYPALIAIQSDASKEEDANDLYKEVEALGGIDILYHNAGVGVPPLNLGVPNNNHLKGAIYEMEVNYFGVIRLNNLFMDMLKDRKEAAIIHTTSILSIVPSAIEATYSSSKTALAFYVQSLRKHLQIINSKLKIFELLPPLVDTDMVANRDDKKISPSQLISGLINGLENNKYTVRIGDSKVIYLLNRLLPKVAFGLINSKKNNKKLLVN
ncbi:SDR family NAD(P)-dependent oxidoreductase [Sphingobacterium alkalisoli]|uniref:SDR family NAD(P)-dependent oxidoreductase n=1 Tax=Sphingobacterium alkalisoli TaxID=1874115 RepID=A0A4V5LXG6_9SPHI|nr:SDR family NAD(P)-dependent oxidoreductase [Sphingobacterium alkalisoli]TJY62509.1 SDR family NAD(P)-dependent oxidoreductase [Sphingobacterium alkalisoli]GGH29031.1 oxidoreductase [Sphingobacterium alkalisoli]